MAYVPPLKPTKPRLATERLRYNRSGSGIALRSTLTLALAAASCAGIYVVFSESPYIVAFLIDTIFCILLVSTFQSRYRYIFLLHPLILFTSAMFFTRNFLDGGDGPAYYAVIKQYIDTTTLHIDFGNIIQDLGVIGALRYMNLGALPTFVIPEILFSSPAPEVFYLFQSSFYIATLAVSVMIVRSWNIIRDRHLFSIVAFSVVSPSFFDLGATPTRHFVTYLAVFLALTGYLGISNALTASRLLIFVFGIILLVVLRAPLVLGLFIFVLVDVFFLRAKKVNLSTCILVVAAIVIIAMSYLYFNGVYEEYASEIAQTGGDRFSKYTQIPVIGAVVKLVYALLSPFPWSKASSYVDSPSYSGNWMLFAMHVGSSLSGVYLLMIVGLKWRTIYSSDHELRRIVSFALIMSTSVIMGAIGFHTYLLIYFPFLAPLMVETKYKISLFFPITFVVAMELFTS